MREVPLYGLSILVLLKEIPLKCGGWRAGDHAQSAADEALIHICIVQGHSIEVRWVVCR